MKYLVAKCESLSRFLLKVELDVLSPSNSPSLSHLGSLLPLLSISLHRDEALIIRALDI